MAAKRPAGKRVALFPVKGGTGKTTLALALAGAAAQRGLRVLVVDVETRTSRAAQSLLAGGKPPVGEVHAGLGHWSGVRVMRWDGVSDLPDDQAHLTIIDCPADPDMAEPAARVADLVLIPVQPEPFAVVGVRDAHDVLSPAEREKVRIVVNGYDGRERLHREELAAMREHLASLLVPGVVIPRRAAIPRAQAQAAPLQLVSVRGLDDVLPAIESLLDAVLAQLNVPDPKERA